MKINFTAISVLVLAISVFSSAMIISNSINTNNNSVPASVEHKEELDFNKQLLTKEEVSLYLGITTQQFEIK